MRQALTCPRRPDKDRSKQSKEKPRCAWRVSRRGRSYPVRIAACPEAHQAKLKSMSNTNHTIAPTGLAQVQFPTKTRFRGSPAMPAPSLRLDRTDLTLGGRGLRRKGHAPIGGNDGPGKGSPHGNPP